MQFSSLALRAQTAQASDYVQILENATARLQGEKGQVGNFSVNNHIVTFQPHGEALIIGDLHGDMQSLHTILQASNFLERMQLNPSASIIFLGDYGDRGLNSAEIYYIVLSLKLEFPGQVVLLRGNHEGPKGLLAFPHDLPEQFKKRFSKDWKKVYRKTILLFPNLYNAVYVKGRYLLVHGGISPEIQSLQDIADAHEGHNEGLLEDLLWSDPTEESDSYNIYPNPRGVGKLFSRAITQKVLGRLDASILIRGHKPIEAGFMIGHHGKIITLFSRKGAPYYNRQGAYLVVQLAQEFDDAGELAAACVRQF